MGLLDELNDGSPASLSLLTATSEPATDAAIAAEPATAPAPTMADTGPGLLSRIGSGFHDVAAGLGLALGGGVDGTVTGADRDMTGIRSLLNFSLNVLANSGPRYTPAGLGPIIAQGLAAAGDTTQLAELNKQRRDQTAATWGLKVGQQRITDMLTALKVDEYKRARKKEGDVDTEADRRLGAAGGPGVGVTTADADNPLLGPLNGGPPGTSPIAPAPTVVAGPPSLPTKAAPASPPAVTTTPPAATTPPAVTTTAPPAGGPVAPPGGTQAQPAPQPPPSVETPPKPPADATPGRPTFDPSVVTLPKPDFGDLDTAKRQAKTAYLDEVRAAKAAKDAGMLSAADGKYQTAIAAIDKEQRDRQATWTQEQGKAVEAERARVAAAQLEFDKERRGVADKAEQDKQTAATQRELKILEQRGTIAQKRLDDSAGPAATAQSTIGDLDALQMIAPAIMAGGSDPIAASYPQLRNYLRHFSVGDSEDYLKWGAQDAWSQITARLRINAQQSFKGPVSDSEGRLIQQAVFDLGQDPQNLPILMGIMRARELRAIQYHQLREDYVNRPGQEFQTAGMDKAVNEGLGSRDGGKTPGPLFEQPPELVAPKAARGGASKAEVDAAAAADARRYQEYLGRDHPVGVPYVVWGTQQLADGRNLRVPAFRVELPDGRTYDQKFPAQKRAPK